MAIFADVKYCIYADIHSGWVGGSICLFFNFSSRNFEDHNKILPTIWQISVEKAENFKHINGIMCSSAVRRSENPGGSVLIWWTYSAPLLVLDRVKGPIFWSFFSLAHKSWNSNFFCSKRVAWVKNVIMWVKTSLFFTQMMTFSLQKITTWEQENESQRKIWGFHGTPGSDRPA
jgi:hypothetical protein